LRTILLLKGQFFFSPELIVEFDAKAYQPRVIFALQQPFQLDPRVRLEFKGDGSVLFNEGSSIVCKGDTASRPTLAFTQSAAWSVNKTSNVAIPITMSGIGNLIIDSGASLAIDNGSHVIVGSNETDNILISVNRGSLVSVQNSSSSSVPSRLSFQQGSYSLSFDKGSSLSIGQQGAVEINALNGVRQNGVLTSCSFNHASELRIAQGGVLSYAINYRPGVHTQLLKSTWNMAGGRSTGKGVVQLVGTQVSGQLQNLSFTSITAHADEVVRQLINTISSLRVSTVFKGIDGSKKLQLKGGRIVDLADEDEVTSDDAQTGAVYGINGTDPFVYDVNGVRS
jgi:hypothetical protein